MGNTITQYRAAIGRFSGHHSVGGSKENDKITTLHFTGVLLLLLILAGVETHPGPHDGLYNIKMDPLYILNNHHQEVTSSLNQLLSTGRTVVRGCQCVRYFNVIWHTSSSMIQLRFFVLTKLFQAINNPHSILENICCFTLHLK